MRKLLGNWDDNYTHSGQCVLSESQIKKKQSNLINSGIHLLVKTTASDDRRRHSRVFECDVQDVIDDVFGSLPCLL